MPEKKSDPKIGSCEPALRQSLYFLRDPTIKSRLCIYPKYILNTSWIKKIEVTAVGITYFEKPCRDKNIDDCQQTGVQFQRTFLKIAGTPNELFCKKAVLQWVFCWEN